MIEIGNAKIYTGDVIECLKKMPDNSVHCCITSPPYFGLRDYKAGPKMIGLEPTFQLWLDKMVSASAELWRVLRDDGTYWLNIGDKYCNGSIPGGGDPTIGTRNIGDSKYEKTPIPDGFKERDLMMMPARLAIALHSWGWYVRSEIIWAKPNPMPESCKNRPASSHEKIYLLTKKPRYFYDADAVREKNAVDCKSKPKFGGNKAAGYGNPVYSGNEYQQNESGCNQRNVWNIATAPNTWAMCPDCKNWYERKPNFCRICGFDGDKWGGHFAAFPPEIPRRCIMAGTSERGCCPECGNQWERIVETTGGSTGKSWHDHKQDDVLGQWAMNEAKGGHGYNRETKGWQPTCTHALEPVPATVLDIFAGSGTTLEVALSLNRKAIGIELNPEYVELMKSRIMKEASQEN